MTVLAVWFADEELLFEGAELAGGAVEIDAAGGVSHFDVGKHDAGGVELRDLLGLDHLPAAAFGDEGRGAEVLASGSCTI